MNAPKLSAPPLLALAIAIGSVAATAHAQAVPDPAPGEVGTRSLTEADGTRTLEQRIVVPAPPAAVWQAWATSEGFASWAAPMAKVDFRLGGSIESSYNPAAKAGDPANIRNEILAFVPGRMFAIRNVQAPPRTPFDVPAFQSLHTVVLLEPVGERATRVVVVQPGYRSGEPWDGVWKHFEWGNAWTLQQLHKRFVDGPKVWSPPASAPVR